ncbi:MAG: CDP-alcohol phosphatidyltransferase family protein [Bacteroidetes bacterium]|nr:CDP-alcohol phosphatidyltransferase family protein [Bacteroidota bacterium]MBU1116372.1 CDP-alcohol phosphatidyltransferase family protein [Bacteroidota bacterium]MBU1800396.1 CDP-alcohol phosphatidyltransferase family protein [Bacteroidota bacterium]
MKYSKKDIFNISNFVSMLRVLLVMPTAYFLSGINEVEYYRIIVVLFFVGAYLTDLLDGFLARKLNQITEFGKIIDPLADKIFVIMIVFQLFWMKEIPEYYFWIIILRDVIIFTGGIFVSKIIGKVLPSNLLGKITVASIAAFLLAVVCGVQKIEWLYGILLNLSIFLSFASVIGYGIRAYENIKWIKENKNV